MMGNYSEPNHTIVIDCETVAGPLSAQERAEAEADIRSELVQEKAIQARLSKLDTGGALDHSRARIVSIAMYSCITDETYSVSDDSEAIVMAWFVKTMHDFAEIGLPNHRFAGFNILAFDLPLIAIALKRNGLALPGKRIGKWDCVDMMREPFGKYWGNKPLNYYLRCFGIPAKTADGSEVHEMWLQDCANNTKNVEEYCRQDVDRERQLYEALSGMYQL